MRSKPDPVDQPERTARYDCAMCIAENATQYSNTETVLLIFPFFQSPDQHHCSEEAKLRMGGSLDCDVDHVVDRVDRQN